MLSPTLYLTTMKRSSSVSSWFPPNGEEKRARTPFSGTNGIKYQESTAPTLCCNYLSGSFGKREQFLSLSPETDCETDCDSSACSRSMEPITKESVGPLPVEHMTQLLEIMRDIRNWKRKKGSWNMIQKKLFQAVGVRYDVEALDAAYSEQSALYTLFLTLIEDNSAEFDETTNRLINKTSTPWTLKGHNNKRCDKLEGVLNNVSLWGELFDKTIVPTDNCKLRSVTIGSHNLLIWSPKKIPSRGRSASRSGSASRGRSASSSSHRSRAPKANNNSDWSTRLQCTMLTHQTLRFPTIEKAFRKLSADFVGMPEHIRTHLLSIIPATDESLIAFAEGSRVYNVQWIKENLPADLSEDFVKWTRLNLPACSSEGFVNCTRPDGARETEVEETQFEN